LHASVLDPVKDVNIILQNISMKIDLNNVYTSNMCVCLPLFESTCDICGNCVLGPISGSGSTHDLSVSRNNHLLFSVVAFVEFNWPGIWPPALNRFQVMELCNIGLCPIDFLGRDISVGIATHYGLDSPGIESRWGPRFSAPVQIGPGANPASYTVGTGSFPGVKRPGRGVDHPPHLAPSLKKE